MPTQVFVVGAVLTASMLLGRFLTNRAGVPDAAAYVVLGVAAGFLPGIGEVRLSPELVLYLFLPPLLYYAAFFSDPRETANNWLAVVGQSVGLVVATAVAVGGALLFLVPDLGWAVVLAFGAAVAPPDPVAATSVLQRLGAPRRLVTVLESEGLVNDGVALTVFAVAVGSVGMPASAGGVLGRLGVEIVGGVVFGLVVGVACAAVRKRVRDTPSQVLISVVSPYVAFVPAQLVHSSGVLATVVAAVWLGTRGRGLVEPTSRLHTPRRSGGCSTRCWWRCCSCCSADVAGEGRAGLVRAPWRGVARGRAVDPAHHRHGCAVPAPGPAAVPDRGAGSRHARRPGRAAAGRVAAAPAAPGRARTDRGRMRARRATVDAALRELDELAEQAEPDPPGAEALRQVLELRRDQLRGELDTSPTGAPGEEPDGHTGNRDASGLRLRLVEVERATLRRLHEQGRIARPTMVELSQELDLDETQLRRRR